MSAPASPSKPARQAMNLRERYPERVTVDHFPTGGIVRTPQKIEVPDIYPHCHPAVIRPLSRPKPRA